MILKNKKNAVLIALLLTLPFSALAAEGDTTAVEVRGTIIVQPLCHLNGDQPLAYEYGQVVVSDVDSKKVAQTHDIKVTCEFSPTAQLQLTMKSTDVAPGKTNVVTVGDTGMGIALLNAGNGDSEVPLNKPFNITETTVFQLKGQLVNLNPGSVLKTGKFSTSIIIESSYE